jgi:hypothetical protein
MSPSTAPNKTQLGLDELRHRTRRLSQRHRTMLLLVDGQRSLAEVLGLASQAGAATSHFEELIKLGLVELPALTAAPAEPPPQPEAAHDGDLAEVTSVDLLVVPPEPEAVHEPEPVFEPAPPVRAEPEPERLPVLVAELPNAEQAWERTIRLLGTPTRPEPETASMVTAAMPPTPPPRAEPMPPAAEPAPPAPAPARATRPRAPADLPVLSEVDEGAMLQQVRDLLIDTLRLDAPLFGARTFVRVRAAQTADELVDLVWEVEHHLRHARHSRRELLSLQRARELLGLGNTLVADDAFQGFPDTQ